MMRTDDLIITIAYFSIPVQMIISLLRYPRLKSMDWKVRGIMVLFALFIFLCGTGHLLRCTNMTETLLFQYVNSFTAVISLATAPYFLPFVPTLMSRLDANIHELRSLNDNLTESKQHLMTFMAFLCHEIRNPLFAITSSITFLGDELLQNPETSKELKCIGQSADLMLRLVNDVLDIAKLEAGKMELEDRVFDLPQLLQGVTSSMGSHINNPNIQFSSHVPSHLPHKVKGDSIRILQVLYNLLTNAKKFTKAGSISLKSQVYSRGASRSSPDDSFSDIEEVMLVELDTTASTETADSIVVEFVVSDTGCGIPQHRIHHIFEPYAQSKLSDYRKHGGTGLGLSIISKLVQLMRGGLSIQTSEKVGSQFTVLLPLYKAADTLNDVHGRNLADDEYAGLILSNSAVSRTSVYHTDENISTTYNLFGTNCSIVAQPPVKTLDHVAIHRQENGVEKKESPPESPLAVVSKRPSPVKKYESFDEQTKQVLIVDDNAVNRKILCRMLKMFGLQHVTAEDGLQAVKEMQQRGSTFGLILMDLCMPVMDGLEATKQIREMGFEDIPIIALTANALEEGAEDAFRAGATEFATKPILRDDSYAKCKHYLDIQGVV